MFLGNMGLKIIRFRESTFQNRPRLVSVCNFAQFSVYFWKNGQNIVPRMGFFECQFSEFEPINSTLRANSKYCDLNIKISAGSEARRSYKLCHFN